ncbi:MAG: TatD family hydrolase [Planctomycetaceae bacterium]|nr:TatD family hydrolase [Planctomycetaceae bacterium]
MLIDTHCHLDADAFRHNLAEVLAEANSYGVTRMVTIGTDLASSEAAIRLAAEHSCVYPVVGIHPNYTAKAAAGDWDRIERLARQPEVVGIGETGLDLYWDTVPLPVQQDYFQRHMQLSREVGKPFVVHCRDAENEVLQMLREDFRNGPLNGVMHSYCGSADGAAECVAMGMYISLAGMVTYKNNSALREMARTIPPDRLVVETDSPYLAPHPNRGKRNQPGWVRFTAECVAQTREIDFEEFSRLTTQNACRLFSLSPVTD